MNALRIACDVEAMDGSGGLVRPKGPSPVVLIVQAVVKQYRVPFFVGLHEALARSGVRLRVAYSGPTGKHQLRRDNTDLPDAWATKVSTRRLFGERLLYQAVFPEVRCADLVIVEHANKHLVNHVLLVLSALGKKRMAFWGHGRNRFAERESLRGAFKRFSAKRADWWFAYTAGTARYLTDRGFPQARITVVNNATDVAAFQAEVESVGVEELAQARQRLGIPPEASIGVFCGALYAEKEIRFLVEAAQRIRNEERSFHLLVLGDGPEREVIERAAAVQPWIHRVGATFGREKAILFRLADIVLNPGVVGLVVLDAFAAGLPVLTTDVHGHGPEIEYLAHGENGLMVAHDEARYARAALECLRDRQLRSKLVSGANRGAREHTMERMVRNFTEGILACLGSEPPVASHRRHSERRHVMPVADAGG